MLTMLIAYDENGDVVATLDHMVARDEDGNVVGLVDFESHEEADGSLTDVWQVGNAVGSGTWPEWIGSKAYEFKVEREGKRIKALVHKQSGHRREKAAVKAAINERIKAANGAPADIRDIVGGPDRPLLIDDEGRTRPRQKVERPNLPVTRIGNLNGGGNNGNLGPSGAVPREGTGPKAHNGPNKA